MVETKIKKNDNSMTKQYRQELLQVADTVAREKGIEREEVMLAMEQAMQRIATNKYGQAHDIKVTIDRNNGGIKVHRYFLVLDKDAPITDVHRQIALDQAKSQFVDAVVGEYVAEELPVIEFGRVAAQNARQVIVQKVREAERNKQFEEFRNRLGDIVNGVVKRIEFGNIIVDIGRTEALLTKKEIIPREIFHIGDRIRVLINELNPESRGPMVMLSRTHPKFMAKLFEQEVPEIYDGLISIKSVARDPGSRAKIAVYTADTNLDAVGSCVGVRGSRVQSIIAELKGEKIDIIPWSSDTATYVVNALAPAEILRVVVDEEAKKVDVVVDENNLSIAIGRKGQNVKLAAQLCGWKIDILTEDDDVKRRATESSAIIELFTKVLDVDEIIAHLLMTEGFSTIEEVAYVNPNEFASIEGFDEELVNELQNRARLYLEELERQSIENLKNIKVDEELLNFAGLNQAILLKLSDNNIQNLENLADLSGVELVEIVGEENLDIESANSIIMRARKKWL